MHGQPPLHPNASGSLGLEPKLSQKRMREKQRSIVPQLDIDLDQKRTWQSSQFIRETNPESPTTKCATGRVESCVKFNLCKFVPRLLIAVARRSKFDLRGWIEAGADNVKFST